ncbi:MAG: type II toxin-antitoxin system VapC family toxin [Actinomycetota bacterium]
MNSSARATDGFLIDSNVLLDIATRDPDWYEWSGTAMSSAARGGPLYLNPLIYAEVSERFDDISELDRLLPPALLKRSTLPYSAAFLAGKAFMAYRRRGGRRRSPQPDFYIGAHAVVANLTLVTRDRARYSTYFPTVQLLTPDSVD